MFREASAIPGRRVLAISDLCLHNRYFGLLDGVVAAVKGQFAEWPNPMTLYGDYAQLLKTLW